MKHTFRILTLALLMSTMTALTQPAMAARLASVSGEAGAEEISREDKFKLRDQDTVRVNYDVQERGKNCSVHIKVYREQNGRWLIVNTVLRTNSASKGGRNLALSAGSYKIKVIATHAKFDVSVDN